MILSKKTLSITLASIVLGTILTVFSLDSCKKFPEGFLHVTTDTIEALDNRNYKLIGKIESIGEENITQHGFCWATTSNPTTSSDTTQLGARGSKGSFNSTISGLSANTAYHVKAYVITDAGTAYGGEKLFTTLAPDLATVTTNPVTNITSVSAQSGGEVIDDGGATVTAKGVCWSTSPDPTTSDSKTSDGIGTERYTSTMTGLNCGTTYYVKAYATNASGTSYGDQVTFNTSQCTSDPPTVTTYSISNITLSSAQGGGSITEGSLPVSAKGVCWSTSQNPTTSNSKTTDGNGPGVFTSYLTGLVCGTPYYVRAYATTSNGTTYGSEVSFNTSACPVPPTVITNEISDIGVNWATGGGSVTNDGGATVTAYGVCWSTSPDPTTSSSKTNDGTGTDSFTSGLTGLSAFVTYYVKAYATNSAGTSYGNQVTFKSSSVTDYDGNVYKIVDIGSQTWMADNLKVTHFADGSEIPLVEGGSGWAALTATSKAYCWYNNTTTNRDLYGGLYTWAAAVNGSASSDANPSGVQGVCPDGWHLPSDSEWTELTDHLGGNSIAGGKLKEAGTINWSNPNTGATNVSGFTALPGGGRSGYNGAFLSEGDYAYFWPATEFNASLGKQIYMSYNDAVVYRDNYDKYDGTSIRCVKDE